MKLRTNLIIGFSSMVILLLTAGTMAYISVNRVSRNADISEKNILLLDLASRLQLTIGKSLMPPNDYLITHNIAEREEFALIANQVNKMIRALLRFDILTDKERHLLLDIDVEFERVKDKAQDILFGTLTGKDAAEKMEEMDAISNAAIRKVDLLNQRAYEKVVKTAYQERLYRKHTNVLLLVCATLFIIDASISGIFIWRSISRPLWLLQDGVRTITDGNLDHRVFLRTRGEFKGLADSFNVMVERLQGAFSDLEKENNKLQTILLNIVDGVIVTDAEYHLLFMNPVAETILGKRHDEFKGKGFFGFHEVKDKIMKILQGNQLPVTTKINHNSSVLHVTAASIKGSDGAKIGYIMVVRDITEQERARERLEEQAITDSLTKLYNYGYLQHCLEYEFLKAQRYNTPLSLIMLDIDYFKTFNDEYGHQMGDIVLVTLAKLLKDTVRKIDIVARYGGEEFVAILPHTGPKESEFLAERLREKAEGCVISSSMDHHLNITISLGVATFANNNFKDKEEFIKSADVALYKAKRGGRNRVEMFQQTMEG
jgi:diguanylate cyclase (GGDEF)-like protein/PAS domain S-box-containing protein